MLRPGLLPIVTGSPRNGCVVSSPPSKPHAASRDISSAATASNTPSLPAGASAREPGAIAVDAIPDDKGQPPSRGWGQPRRLLTLALGGASLWWVMLTAMALFTANPVLISVPQFQRATIIVTAEQLNPATNTARVTRVWRGEAPSGEIEVLNLQELRSLAPGSYLLLLRRLGPKFVIVKTELQTRETPPLVYPATTVATTQLERLLSTDRPKSGKEPVSD